MSAPAAAQEALVDLYARELRLPGLRKAYRELAPTPPKAASIPWPSSPPA